MLGFATLPYRRSAAACSDDIGEERPQVLQVEEQQPLLVGDAKGMLRTPSCMSLRSSIRERSSGPISEMVARTGWPCSPNRSQNTAGNSSGS